MSIAVPPPTPLPPVSPDAGQALAFLRAIFAGQTGEVNFRAKPECGPGDKRGSRNFHYRLDAADFPERVAEFVAYCAAEGRAAYVLPAVVRAGGTGKADVLSMPALLVDFDRGCPASNLAAVEALIGRATVVVESGGETPHGKKLHAHWVLQTPAADAGSIAELCAARELLALNFGGDTAFKQPGQPIRISGSVHFKPLPAAPNVPVPKPVRLIRCVEHADAQPLAAISAKLRMLPMLPVAAPAPAANSSVTVGGFNFDFSRDVEPANDITRVLTQPTLAEGKSPDGATRFTNAGKAIGHYIAQVRAGRMTLEAAWLAAVNWNEGTMRPPWDEDRLRGDFERLVAIDISANGVFLAPDTSRIAATGSSLIDWRADSYEGEPPAREWLVDGLLPAATAGLLAAVGDAGKSMLALRLAFTVACDPLPVDATRGLLGPIGVSTFFGRPVTTRGAAVVLTAEDDRAEVHRRIHALDPTNTRKGKPLYVLPMLSIGGARSIITDSPTGPVPTPFWTELRDQLLAIDNLKLIVLDPLSHFVGADTNDNTVGTATMSLAAELASATGATVMLVHHLTKATRITGLVDARTAIRGAGAWVDNGRWALVIWEQEEKAAAGVLAVLGQDNRRGAGIVYQGGLAKGNAPGEKSLRTLVRNPMTGLLEDCTDALRSSSNRGDRDRAAFEALKAKRLAGTAFQFGLGRDVLWKAWNPVFIAAKVKVAQREVVEMAERFLEQGLLIETDTVKGGYPQFEPKPD